MATSGGVFYSRPLGIQPAEPKTCVMSGSGGSSSRSSATFSSRACRLGRFPVCHSLKIVVGSSMDPQIHHQVVSAQATPLWNYEARGEDELSLTKGASASSVRLLRLRCRGYGGQNRSWLVVRSTFSLLRSAEVGVVGWQVGPRPLCSCLAAPSKACSRAIMCS